MAVVHSGEQAAPGLGRHDETAGPDLERTSEDFGAQGEVEAGAVARQSHQQDAGPLKD
jgi:hypothetical protein